MLYLYCFEVLFPISVKKENQKKNILPKHGHNLKSKAPT